MYIFVRFYGHIASLFNSTMFFRFFCNAENFFCAFPHPNFQKASKILIAVKIIKPEKQTFTKTKRHEKKTHIKKFSSKKRKNVICELCTKLSTMLSTYPHSVHSRYYTQIAPIYLSQQKISDIIYRKHTKTVLRIFCKQTE